ncbi:MAG: hypothetical protein NZL87_09340 [Thermomicrobium sp.]|nr:hypothetical protein [Thermomicrobium sp.]MDW8059127.1 hypothetical protein [Thermomicrobium sp.]
MTNEGSGTLGRITIALLPALAAALLVPLVSCTRLGPAAAVGFRSFADSGRQTIRLSDPLPSAFELFPLDLPPTPGPVVTLFLHLRIELDPSSPPGTLSVWDQRAGASALLLRVRWSPEPTGGMLEWDTLDLFAGPRRGMVLGPSVELVLANIVPDDWRRPGTAPLSLHFAREGPIRVRSVLVYPDSGIEIARRGPPALWVSVAAPRDPPPVGTPFELRVHLAPRGRTPPRVARLELLPSPCVRSASGEPSLAWSNFARATSVRLRLERLTTEPCSFQLAWNTEQASGTVTVQLPRSEES